MRWTADVTLAACCQENLAKHERRFPGQLDAVRTGTGGPCPVCRQLVVKGPADTFIRERRSGDRVGFRILSE